MKPNNINVILTLLVLLIPYGLIWLASFQQLKKRLNTKLHYSFLTLVSLIAFLLYFALLFAITNNDTNGIIGGAVKVASLVTLYISIFTVYPAIIIALILTIVFYIKDGSKKSTY